MLSKSSKWELGFVYYIAKFTISRFVISRFECIRIDIAPQSVKYVTISQGDIAT